MAAFAKKLITVAVALLLCASVLAACAGKEPEVSKINIVNGSFKESYNLDEQINYDNIQILITYKNDTKKQIKVQKDWITGLDVATTGINKKLIITYQGVSASFIYSVSYKANISTPVRLGITESGTDSYKVVQLALGNLDKMPIYAVKIDISLNGLAFVSKEDNISEDWDVATKATQAKLTLFFYSKNGGTRLQDGYLTELTLSGQADQLFIEVSVSDGDSDHKAPDVSYKLNK